MEALAIFLNDYGLATVLILLLLTNAGNIAGFAERLLSKAWPTFAKQQRLKSERLTAADERIDTILALKEMLLAYRQHLDDTNLERRQLQNRLYELVERYERHAAQSIEVMRDISTVIRSQTERLDRITVKLGMYNHEKPDPKD